MNFKIILLISTKRAGILIGYVLNMFGEYFHFNNIKSSDPQLRLCPQFSSFSALPQRDINVLCETLQKDRDPCHLPDNSGNSRLLGLEGRWTE